MGLLDTNSLSKTLDNVNSAWFYHLDIDRKEAKKTIEWIEGRLNTEFSYAGSFGLTDADMHTTLRTFTGEILSSPASTRHIHAEESSRALLILNRVAKQRIPELAVSDRLLLGCILTDEQKGKPRGTFCCGPCTVSLWRHLSVGGLGDYGKNLNEGLRVLSLHENKEGTWRRFPFFYTLSALVELSELPNAKKALAYARPAGEKKIRTLRNKTEYDRRRRQILEMVLENNYPS